MKFLRRGRRERALADHVALRATSRATIDAHSSTASDCTDNQKGLRARRDGFGERSVRRLVREVLLAGKESQAGSATVRDVIADRAAKHRVGGFERIKDCALSDRAVNVEIDLGVHLRQCP